MKRAAENVASFRRARQLQQKDLSARLREVGRPMLPTVISKIERGERRIDVDDLIALALALNVSPLALLLPTTGDAEASCELAEGTELPAAKAWKWADGIQPVSLSELDPAGDIQRFQLDSRPPFARHLLTPISGDFSPQQMEKLAAAGYVHFDEGKAS